MDFVNKLTGGGDSKTENNTTTQQEGNSSSSSGGIMGKLNSMAGGGKESEKNEDALDKGKPASPSNYNHRLGSIYTYLPS